MLSLVIAQKELLVVQGFKALLNALQSNCKNHGAVSQVHIDYLEKLFDGLLDGVLRDAYARDGYLGARTLSEPDLSAVLVDVTRSTLSIASTWGSPYPPGADFPAIIDYTVKDFKSLAAENGWEAVWLPASVRLSLDELKTPDLSDESRTIEMMKHDDNSINEMADQAFDGQQNPHIHSTRLLRLFGITKSPKAQLKPQLEGPVMEVEEATRSDQMPSAADVPAGSPASRKPAPSPLSRPMRHSSNISEPRRLPLIASKVTKAKPATVKNKEYAKCRICNSVMFASALAKHRRDVHKVVKETRRQLHCFFEGCTTSSVRADYIQRHLQSAHEYSLSSQAEVIRVSLDHELNGTRLAAGSQPPEQTRAPPPLQDVHLQYDSEGRQHLSGMPQEAVRGTAEEELMRLRNGVNRAEDVTEAVSRRFSDSNDEPDSSGLWGHSLPGQDPGMPEDGSTA